MQMFEEAGRPVERAVFMMFVLVVEYYSIPRCKIHVLREIDLRSLIAPTRTGLKLRIPLST